MSSAVHIGSGGIIVRPLPTVIKFKSCKNDVRHAPPYFLIDGFCTQRRRHRIYVVCSTHRLIMELDLQSLFGLYVTWCAQLLSLAETPQLPPQLGSYTRGAIGQQRQTTSPCNPLVLQYLPIEKDVVCEDKDAEAGVEEDKEVLEAGAGEEESCELGKLRGGGQCL
jgi:hypothetical protein